MTVTRRRFLQSASATLGTLALPSVPAGAIAPPAWETICTTPVPAAASTRLVPGASAFPLTAGVCERRIREEGPQTSVWAFNGTSPGPGLRYKQGDTVEILVTNRLPQPTTVHWHGVRLPHAMDGVPYVTQPPIPPGGTFAVRYAAIDAGTYWYHPHQSSFEQVPRGLYGMMVVEEAKPLRVDRELEWVLADFKLDAGNRQVEDFGRVRDFGSEGRLGNVVTLNGTAAGANRTIDVRPGERLRVRMVNAASARAFVLEFGGLAPWIVTHDGQPVPPHAIPDGRLLLGSGQRTDLVIDVPDAAGKRFTVTDQRRGGEAIVAFSCTGRPVRAKPAGRPAAIAANRLLEPNLAKATDHYLVFEGGIGGEPAIGRVDGRALNVDEIMKKHGLAWTMNYTTQQEHAMMHEPLFRFRRGEHVTLKIMNNTDYEHPIHLHGHFFRVLALNDVKTRLREWRDTVMIDARGSADIAFVAENVGEWMFHCHILDHAAGGMMGTVVVEG